ncbi:hypothetical protein [Cryptosporangium japonicum]|uniref:Excreted virulence factor EspC (Type VII ESX diderm) n=1 Tax=Cryptosporangium japonicum TaxID=80872 RepID=A0ABN0V8Z5_9ACTN
MGWVDAGDTDELAHKGGRLDGAVVDNGGKAAAAVARLRELEAQRLAGGDVLEALNLNYFKPTEIGTSFNQAVSDQIDDLVKDAENMGTNVISAAVDYKLQDTNAAADVRQATANIHT